MLQPDGARTVRPATMADVGKRAGVSAATVSRVLNGNYAVAVATRDRVLRAVQELNYVVNGPARALAAAHSDVVGVIVNDISDPFFAQIASGIQAQADTAGKLVVVCNTERVPDRELSHLSHLFRQRARTVVLVGSALEDTAHQKALTERLEDFVGQGGRIVLCGRPPLHQLPQAAAITFDNTGGTRRAVEFLIDLGHHRIGYLTGPPGYTTTTERLRGYREALHRNGIPFDQDLVVPGAFTRGSGVDATKELLRRGVPFTAVTAANDLMALGAIATLRERGIAVPDEVSVVGFDDLPFCTDTAPPLTTVRLPLREAGRWAGRVALGQLPVPVSRTITMQSDLVVRASVRGVLGGNIPTGS